MGKDKIESLMFYKGNGYRYMNNCVRRGIINTDGVVDIESLQQFLLTKRIGESIEAYRYVDLKELKILLKGTAWKRVFEYPSFLSTTLLWNYYSMEDIRRRKICISIRIPRGTPGTYLPEINPERPEYEVLLPYHLKLKRNKGINFEIVG